VGRTLLSDAFDVGVGVARVGRTLLSDAFDFAFDPDLDRGSSQLR